MDHDDVGGWPEELTLDGGGTAFGGTDFKLCTWTLPVSKRAQAEACATYCAKLIDWSLRSTQRRTSLF